MAARIKADLGLAADISEGRRGEFSVSVGDRQVAEKDSRGFPSDDAIVDAVRRATAAN